MPNSLLRITLTVVLASCLAAPALGQTTRRTREDPLSFRTNGRMLGAFAKVVKNASPIVLTIAPSSSLMASRSTSKWFITQPKAGASPISL